MCVCPYIFVHRYGFHYSPDCTRLGYLYFLCIFLHHVHTFTTHTHAYTGEEYATTMLT